MKKWLVAAGILVAAGLIISMVGLAIVGFDFTRLGTQKMVTNTYTVEEAFTNIRLDVITADVTFAPSEDGGVKVVCYEDEKLPHSASVEADSLVITCKDNRKWYDHIGINWQTSTVTVYLPAAEYEKLQIQCTTGVVTVPADFKFQNAELELTTGDVHWKAEVAQTLSIHSTTGSITTEGAHCNTLDIRATTGDVTLVDTLAADLLTVKVSTGAVKLSRADAGEISIETTTGNVSGTLLSSKVFIAETSTGNVDVPNSTSGGKCQITTSTGNIEITIE